MGARNTPVPITRWAQDMHRNHFLEPRKIKLKLIPKTLKSGQVGDGVGHATGWVKLARVKLACPAGTRTTVRHGDACLGEYSRHGYGYGIFYTGIHTGTLGSEKVSIKPVVCDGEKPGTHGFKWVQMWVQRKHGQRKRRVSKSAGDVEQRSSPDQSARSDQDWFRTKIRIGQISCSQRSSH